MKIQVIPQSIVNKLFKVNYPDTVKFPHVREWCDDNCRGAWYAGHDWDQWMSDGQNRCIEFVEEQDAILFVLRFV